MNKPVTEQQAEQALENLQDNLDIHIQVSGSNAKDIATILNHVGQEFGLNVRSDLPAEQPQKPSAPPFQQVHLHHENNHTVVNLGDWALMVPDDRSRAIVVAADTPGGVYVTPCKDHLRVDIFSDNPNEMIPDATARAMYTDLVFGDDAQVQEDGSVANYARDYNRFLENREADKKVQDYFVEREMTRRVKEEGLPPKVIDMVRDYQQGRLEENMAKYDNKGNKKG